MGVAINDDYVGGSSIASSTSAVNYVDVPLSLFTSNTYGTASFNTQFLLRAKPAYSGARFRVQLLDSGGSVTYFGYQIFYMYQNSYGATSSTYSSAVDIGALPVYNRPGFEGVNALIRVNAADAWGASTAPMVRIDPHFYYSNYVTQTRCSIMPYYNTAPTAVSTLRFYFDNTSGANVGTYNLYAGV